MKNIFLDTSILIGFDRGTSKAYLALLDLLQAKKVKLFFSPIVEYEYFVGVKPTKKEINQAKKMIKFLQRINLDYDSVILAAKLARQHQIGSFDCLVAGSCLTHNFQLATLNKKHFKSVKGLQLWTD